MGKRKTDYRGRVGCARRGLGARALGGGDAEVAQRHGQGILVRQVLHSLKRRLSFMIWGCARALAASLAPLSRPVARLRTSSVVTESIHDSLSLACQLKTSTAFDVDQQQLYLGDHCSRGVLRTSVGVCTGTGRRPTRYSRNASLAKTGLNTSGWRSTSASNCADCVASWGPVST